MAQKRDRTRAGSTAKAAGAAQDGRGPAPTKLTRRATPPPGQAEANDAVTARPGTERQTPMIPGGSEVPSSDPRPLRDVLGLAKNPLAEELGIIDSSTTRPPSRKRTPTKQWSTHLWETAILMLIDAEIRQRLDRARMIKYDLQPDRDVFERIRASLEPVFGERYAGGINVQRILS